MIARCGLQASHIANHDRPAWTPIRAVWIALERLTYVGRNAYVPKEPSWRSI